MKIQNMLKKTFIVFLNAKPFRILILCLRREESHFLSSHRKEKSVHHSPLFSFCKNHILFMLFGWGNKKFKICIFVAYYMHMIQKITILDLTFKCHQTLFQTAQSSSHVFTTENAQQTFLQKIKFNSSTMNVCVRTLGCGLFCKLWDSKAHNWPHLYFGQKSPKMQKVTKSSPIWSGAEHSNLGHHTNKNEILKSSKLFKIEASTLICFNIDMKMQISVKYNF